MAKAFILQRRPKARPSVSDFDLVEMPNPILQKGEILVKGMFYSVDPYMRGRMNEGKSYIKPFELGSAIEGGVVGKVMDSKASNYKEGDIVMGMLRWQDVQVVSADKVDKVDPTASPLSYNLGMLGMPGLTALFGLMQIGMPRPNDTLVISGAAGAVGTIVGQIGKIIGCHVIGIASESKLNFLVNELGFDAAIDYHVIKELDKNLRLYAPVGIDIYYDNVGGVVSNHVMQFLRHKARVVICGQISLYNNENSSVGPYPQPVLLKNSASMQGFIVNDFSDFFHQGYEQLHGWYKDGKLIAHETIIQGFDRLPEAFLGLFDGNNIGKMIVEA